VTVGFTVYGRPMPRGSKRAFVIQRKGKPGVAMADSNPKSKDWMEQVRSAAGSAYSGQLLAGPILLQLSFAFLRPRSHYGTGRNSNVLKPSAPREHAQTPDLDKLIRCVSDGLTGVVFQDDKQVSEILAAKCWTEASEGVSVTVDEIADELPPATDAGEDENGTAGTDVGCR